MKRFSFLPRFTAITLGLILASGIYLISETGCAEKPGCGSKRQHKTRAKQVKRMAPSMGGR